MPTGESEVIKTECYLCDVPFDEWFNLRAECRISYKDNMIPYLTVSINRNEKVLDSKALGYNIIGVGGYTYARFGLYCPHWKSATYNNAHRHILVSNVDYMF